MTIRTGTVRSSELGDDWTASTHLPEPTSSARLVVDVDLGDIWRDAPAQRAALVVS